MSFAEVNGQRLYYEVHGEGEPLICVMGLSADHLAWIMQVPEFSEHFKTIVFDNRDVGQSSYADDEYETSDMAKDVLALADALELPSFHLLGVSLGGAISQHVGLIAPERVRTLTLAVTFGGLGNYGIERAQLWSELVATTDREKRIDDLLLLTMSEAFFENPDAVQMARQMLLANPHPQTAEGFGRQVRAAARHELRDRLGELEMPVHVIGAEYDILVPVFKAKEIADLIPDCKYTVLEHAPHGVQIERPDLFNPAVVGFIAAHSQAASAVQSR